MKKLYLFVLVLFIHSLSSASSSDSSNTTKKGDYIYRITDVKPQFPGGVDSMKAFLVKNIQYPKVAMEYHLKGAVIMKFLILETGQIVGIETIQDIGGGWAKEVQRVLAMMPTWKPARFANRNVPVQYYLTILFDDGKKYPMTIIIDNLDTHAPNLAHKNKIKSSLEKIQSGDETFELVDAKPSYPSGDSAMYVFLKEHVTCSTQGESVVKFTVLRDGTITDVNSIKDIGCNTLLIQAIRKMPKWTPALIEERKVNAYYTLKVKFPIQANSFKTTSSSSTPSNTAPTNTVSNEIFTVCEVMPSFVGGQDSLQKYLQKNITDKIKHTENITAAASFVVEKNGTLTEIEIVKSTSPEIDTFIKESISKMPKWNPGKQRTMPVRVRYILPIKILKS